MLRFIQQLETGSGDYPRDRDQFTEPSFEELRQFLAIHNLNLEDES